MDYFLGGQFLTYGMDVLNISEESFNERVDPMSKVFPKLTKCTFNKYGPSGTVEMTDGLCLLAINIINEKIYIFLWFWFATVAIFTGIHMILRFTSIASIQFRRIYLFKRAKANNRNDVSSVVNKLWYGDWFLLMQLSKHYDPVVFQEFMVDLRDQLKLRGQVNQE